MYNLLWVEKYRPKCIEDMAMDESFKIKFKEFLTNKDIPHLLLHGPAGTGKTAIAKILIDEICGYETDYLILNGSSKNNRSIEAMESVVTGFLKIAPFNSDIKIVFIDEADGLTTQAQPSLRNVMESYARNGRFILTCNYPEKIIDALHSRCQSFKFKALPVEDVRKMVGNILDKESVKFDMNVLERIIIPLYPDMRRIIGTCQQMVYTDPDTGFKELKLDNMGSAMGNEHHLAEITNNAFLKYENKVFVGGAVYKILQLLGDKQIDHLLTMRLLFDKSTLAPAKACIAKYTNEIPKAIDLRMLFFAMFWDCLNIYRNQ